MAGEGSKRRMAVRHMCCRPDTCIGESQRDRSPSRVLQTDRQSLSHDTPGPEGQVTVTCPTDRHRAMTHQAQRDRLPSRVLQTQTLSHDTPGPEGQVTVTHPTDRHRAMTHRPRGTGHRHASYRQTPSHDTPGQRDRSPSRILQTPSHDTPGPEGQVTVTRPTDTDTES